MRILIDADGCPVTNIAVSISKSHGLECIIVCDSSHIFNYITGLNTYLAEIDMCGFITSFIFVVILI